MDVRMWKGVFPALVTPFTAEGDLDERLFHENVEMSIVEDGVHGILVGGCTGEFWALTLEERARIIRWAVEQARGRVPVVAGTGGIRTADVIQLSEHARQVGADAALILPPFFVKVGLRELLAHYSAVAEAVDIPLIVYNVPAATGLNLTPAMLDQLVEIPSIVAVKESSGDYNQFFQTVRTVGDRVAVFCGVSSLYGLPAMLVGAAGYICTSPQALGRDVVDLYRLSLEGEHQRALEIQAKGVGFRQLSVANGRNMYVSLKEIMNQLGRPGGYPRRPLLPLEEADRREIREGIAKLGLRTRGPATKVE